MKRLWILALLLTGGVRAQVRITQPAQLYPNVVTTPAIAYGAVTADKLASGVVPNLTWGSVTGTLANQTDLWAVLNGKAPLVSGLVPASNLGTGTASASTYLRGDGTWTASNWLTSASTLDASKLTGTASVNTSGTAAGLSSTLGVGSGGTGATTASAARTALGAAGLGANTFTGGQTIKSGDPQIALVNTVGANSYNAFITSNAGFSSVYNAIALGVNANRAGVQSNAVLPSWALDLGGGIDASKVQDALTIKRLAAGGSTWNNVFTILGSGNVGIGTTSPTYALHVAPSSGDTAGQTAFFKGSTDTGVVIKGGSSQAARYLDVQNSSGTTLAYITSTGGIVSNDATKGVVLKSPNAHYWRITVGDTGTLTTTDLGTTAP